MLFWGIVQYQVNIDEITSTYWASDNFIIESLYYFNINRIFFKNGHRPNAIFVYLANTKIKYICPVNNICYRRDDVRLCCG